MAQCYFPDTNFRISREFLEKKAPAVFEEVDYFFFHFRKKLILLRCIFHFGSFKCSPSSLSQQLQHLVFSTPRKPICESEIASASGAI